MESPSLAPRMFLEGPSGTGKTTFVLQHRLGRLLQEGVAAESILVLVPQRTLGFPYQDYVRTGTRFTGDVTMLTLGGLARRNLDRFWPLVARQAGLDQGAEPTFLTIESAQYHMMRFVRPAVDEGVFDSIGLAPPRIAAQLLDNMAKAAIAGFSFEELADRLCAAWGDRHSSRLQVYRISQDISSAYRQHCLDHNLLDYALQLELFSQYLMALPVFRRYFAAQYQHLIADNVEEAGPLVHDFIAAWWDDWDTATLVMDSDGGYRTFLGASPDNAVKLRDLCEQYLRFDASVSMSNAVQALETEIHRALRPVFAALPQPETDPVEAFRYAHHVYYPQMLDWVVRQVAALVEGGVSLHEIVILTPFLPDSLRFALQSRLERAGIQSISHRPSRALRDEPLARVMITLLALAHPDWGMPVPPRADIVDVFVQVIDGLDPVRARLLADIVYKPGHGGALTSFEQIQPAMRERITYVAGERYESLRTWLEQERSAASQRPMPPDYFLSRLFGEVLSQPGFGFHSNLEGGRVAAQLIESARKFRQVLYPHWREEQNWAAVGQEYMALVDEGVLAALYTESWRDDNLEAILLVPAFTFLMRNRVVDYQFWLDVGSDSWWKRLDQPLTHPYVLTRHYPQERVWTEIDEDEQQREMLHRLMTGLLRRCRRGIYLGISDLGEQGYEQRGPMLYVFQQILQKFGGEQVS